MANRYRKGLILISFFLLSGCYAQVPRTDTFDFSTQKKLQAAKHWEIMARDISDQISYYLKYEDLNLANQFGVYIEPLPGEFGEAFTRMVRERLVETGVRVVHRKEDCAVVIFELSLIKHDKKRFHRPPRGTFTAIAAGVFVLREITWNTLAGLAVPIAAAGDVIIGKLAALPRHEILVTTALVGTNNRYLYYRNDLYYIRDAEWKLYPTEEIEEETPVKPQNPETKTFQVMPG